MSWTKWNQSPLPIPKDSLYQKEMVLGIWWYFKRIIYYELLLQKQTSNLDKYCSQLGWLKAAINEKHQEATYWKILSSIRTMPDISFQTCRNCPSLPGTSYRCSTYLLLHLQITTNFNPHRILLMGRDSLHYNTLGTTLTSLSPKKMPCSGRMESWSCFKAGEK